jgi:Protein predicted to be involved in meiotic recombination
VGTPFQCGFFYSSWPLKKNYLNELFIVPPDLDDAQSGTSYVVSHDISDILIHWIYFLNSYYFDEISSGIDTPVVNLGSEFFQHLLHHNFYINYFVEDYDLY